MSTNLEELRFYTGQDLEKAPYLEEIRKYNSFEIPKLRVLHMENIPELILKDYLITSLRRELTALTFLPKKPISHSFFTKSLKNLTKSGLEVFNIKFNMSTLNYKEERAEIIDTINRNAQTLKTLNLYIEEKKTTEEFLKIFNKIKSQYTKIERIIINDK